MYHGKFKKYTHAEMAEFTHEQLSGNAGLIFVYDRTQEDVDRVKYLNERYLMREITEEERKEWSRGVVQNHTLAYELGIRGTQGLKGAINLSDMQRIEWNEEVIADLLDVAIEVREWSYSDIPTIADYKRIRENVKKLRNALFKLSQTPNVPEQPLNTYQKWNDIEKILNDVYTSYMAFLRSKYYCDTELYAGEGVGEL